MEVRTIKEKLMEGAELVFAKRHNANRNVRGCHAIVFDRRKGFHVVEQSLKQVRRAIETEGGIYLLQLKDDKILTVTQYGEDLVTELPPELEEETFQKLPRFDFSVQVQSQRFLKKIGFF